jgi:hypothetical protein
MFPMQQIAIGALSACLVLWSPLASAQVASFSIPLHATLEDGGFPPGLTAGFAPTGNRDLSFTFDLPRDYVNNTAVSIVLLVSSNSGPCSARLIPHRMMRRRGGTPVLDTLDGVDGGNAVFNIPELMDINKTFKIAPSGALADLKRGDSIMLQIRRTADDPADNCVGVFVGGIDVRYTTF